MNTERILPKMILVNWRDKLILKQWKNGHTRTGFEQSRREQAPLHEELADRERALRDTRVRSIQKLEELKREQEFRLEEFSEKKNGRKLFKDVESVRSGQLFHVPIQPSLFPVPVEPEGEDC